MKVTKKESELDGESDSRASGIRMSASPGEELHDVIPSPASASNGVRSALDDYVMVGCSGCGRINLYPKSALPSQPKCSSCAKHLNYEESEKEDSLPRKIVPEGSFDEHTGILKRRRENLGFGQVVTGDDDLDPNAMPEGSDLEDLINNWYEFQIAPWEEEVDSGKSERINWPLSIVVALLALSIPASVLIYQWREAKKRQQSSDISDVMHIEPLSNRSGPGETQSGRTVNYDPSLAANYESAQAVARKFLSAQSLDDLIPLVRDSGRVVPLMRLHYDSRPVAPIEFDDIESLESIRIGEQRVFVNLAFAHNQKLKGTVMLEKSAVDAPFKVDWESFTAYSEVDWREFKDAELDPGKTVMVRAFMAVSDRYDAPFSDEEKYIAFRLQNRDGEYFIAYLPRDDRLVPTLLAEIEKAAGHWRDSIVRIRRPEGAATPEIVELSEFIQAGWVIWDRAGG